MPINLYKRLSRCVAALCAALAFAGCNTLLDDRVPPGLCGDGILQSEMGEECDDGNNTPGDKCSATCKIEECGNGVPEPPEECDKGLLNDNNGDCTMLCKKAACGDGHLHSRGTAPFERCDDHNTKNGDGCNPQCKLRGRVTVIAGTPGGRGLADGVGPAARFGGIRGLASDDNYVYVADSSACSIRRLAIDTGQV